MLEKVNQQNLDILASTVAQTTASIHLHGIDSLWENVCTFSRYYRKIAGTLLWIRSTKDEYQFTYFSLQFPPNFSKSRLERYESDLHLIHLSGSIHPEAKNIDLKNARTT